MTDPTTPGDAAAQPAPAPAAQPAPPSYPAAPPAPAAPAYSAPGTATGEDPGKTLGIVALILAFVFQLLGLILGIVARNKSKAAGYKNGIATAAIWLSIVFMVLGLIIGIGAIVAGGALFGGFIGQVAEVCNELGPGVWEIDGATYTCE